LVEILTVFSSRLYGSRSRKNLRALEVKQCYNKHI
jgi:predicted site-specific integrase-resolvase